ncbi:MAG: hypothetical protein U9Q62_06905 [Campylobacterota bacterium]|nr:hypothetical protein [Campylobacterota bacterium]
MRLFKAALSGLFAAFLTVLLIFGSWVLWERNRDPFVAVDFYPGKVSLSDDTSYTIAFSDLRNRSYRHIILSTEHLGDIEAFISQPKVIPPNGLPIVIIMGGLEVGRDDFKLIPDPGENIYIIFKYPYTPEYWYEGAPLVEIPVIRKSVLSVPSQALTLYRWASEQPWAEERRVLFTGFSFGAMFLPAIYHLAAGHDEALNPGVIAYAGVDISDILYTNLEELETPWRSLAAWLGETAIYGVEPARHLPYTKNDFLLINGTKDHQISPYSWKRLHQLTPDPKTVVILNEGHMHPRKPELTRKLVKISREWLLERGLVN